MTTTENIDTIERIRSRLAILDAFVSRYDVGYNQVELVGGDDGILYVRRNNANGEELNGCNYQLYRVWENGGNGSGIYSFTEETKE